MERSSPTTGVPPLPSSPTDGGRAHISVVIPLYRCADCIPELYRRLVTSLSAITSSFEIILVNDGSPQNDWQIARDIARQDPRVKAFNLSRNFGQHYALTAGLDYADGDWVVVMDGDLQDPPEEIATLYAKAREGHDIVFGRKPQRTHSLFKRLTSRAFTATLGFLMGEKLDNAVTHFSIVSRDVVRNLRRFAERNRSYAFLVRWLGFDVAYVDVQHHARYAGDGSYTLRRLIHLASELVVSQTERPLRMSIGFGFASASLAFVYGVYLVLRYLFWKHPAEGWTSVIVSIYFLGGLLFVALGVVGLYVGRIFEETKHRPLYVVKDAVNVAAESAAGGEQTNNHSSRSDDLSAQLIERH